MNEGLRKIPSNLHHHHSNHRMLRLVFIFANTLRAFGLYPYRYDRQDQLPFASWKWRIYSALCVSSYILAFTGFCVYAIYRERERSIDSLMDFVRMSEVVMITVTLCSVIITEQSLYGPCYQVLYTIHQTLKDIFEDFISSTEDKTLDSWFYRQVMWTVWKCLLLTILLLIISASIGYVKCIMVLTYLPAGWNYLSMTFLVIPFLALSLSCAKVCAYVHAIEHGFQMLNKQLQVMVQEVNELNQRRHGKSLPNKCNEYVPHLPSSQHPGTINYSCLPALEATDYRLLYRKQKRLLHCQQSIHRIRAKHDTLCGLVEEFFKHWALYLLVFLTMHFSLVVIEAFFLFTNVYTSVRSGQDIDMEYALLNLRACLMLGIELTWTIGSCSSLMDSMRQIGVTLNALVLVDREGTGGAAVGFAQAIETWTIKLLCQPNAVQVFRLFDINNGLLFSVGHVTGSKEESRTRGGCQWTFIVDGTLIILLAEVVVSCRFVCPIMSSSGSAI